MGPLDRFESLVLVASSLIVLKKPKSQDIFSRTVKKKKLSSLVGGLHECTKAARRNPCKELEGGNQRIWALTHKAKPAYPVTSGAAGDRLSGGDEQAGRSEERRRTSARRE